MVSLTSSLTSSGIFSGLVSREGPDAPDHSPPDAVA